VGTLQDRGGSKRRTPGDTRWLELRGLTWHCVMDVPRPLRAAMDRKRMVKSLQTRDRTVAVARRHAAIAEFQLAFARARRTAEVDPIVTAAMEWRTTLATMERGEPAALAAFASPGASETFQDAQTKEWVELGQHDLAAMEAADQLGSEAERIAGTEGDTAAQTFLAIARGHVTPLLHYVDAWLAEGGGKGPLKVRTQRQYRRDLDQLHSWLTRSRLPPTIEAVTKPVAGRYVTDMIGDGTDRKTANRKISAVSAYWRWLLKRTNLPANPWSGQSLAKSAVATSGIPKRPFTDHEVATLLTGTAQHRPDPELLDAMMVAALSGMRIEEVYRLTVVDTTGRWFNIKDAKTRAGIRRVPIHSALVALVERRCAAKEPAAYVFHEAGGPPRPGYERSMPASKRFGHYRRRVGVHEREPGRRQSNVDFHSFRRWFVTQARNAGADLATVAAVVGHGPGNITDAIYSGGPSEALLRACVEAVRLPEGVQLPAPVAPPTSRHRRRH
jgi:integrase